ncbi:MAG: hypothetical protein LBH29_02225 [Elusimicrobiota bacterium]|jgi:hypothetical protein|nr:hypothetical protein [Elusimicrobiota bacterium]
MKNKNTDAIDADRKDFDERLSEFIYIADNGPVYDFWFFKESVFLINASEKFLEPKERLRLLEKLSGNNVISAIAVLKKESVEKDSAEHYEVLKSISKKNPFAEKVLQDIDGSRAEKAKDENVKKVKKGKNKWILIAAAVIIAAALFFVLFPAKEASDTDKDNAAEIEFDREPKSKDTDAKSGFNYGGFLPKKTELNKYGLIDYKSINPNAVIFTKNILNDSQREQSLAVLLIAPILKR